MDNLEDAKFGMSLGWLSKVMLNIIIDLDVTNKKLAEVEKQQKAVIEQLKVDVVKLRDDNAELGNKCEQQGQELDVTNQKLVEIDRQQTATIEQLKVDLAKQRDENAKQVELLEEKLAEANNRTEGIQADMEKQREDNIKLTEKCNQLTQELGNAKEQVTALMTNNIHQRNEAANHAQALATANHELQALGRQCSQLIADLGDQRDENTEQAEGLRSLLDRQKRMENMMEEMEEILRQPICIGPEMDQEYEDH